MKSTQSKLFSFTVVIFLFHVQGFSPRNTKISDNVTPPHQRSTTKIEYKNEVSPDAISNIKSSPSEYITGRVTLNEKQNTIDDINNSNINININSSKQNFNYEPRDIDIVKQCDAVLKGYDEDESIEECFDLPPETETNHPFVDMIRSSASYIVNHRNSIVVCHIPGELLEWDGFPDLMDDITLMWSLGIKVVLVVGCRSQIEERLINFEGNRKPYLDKGLNIPVNGIRITDAHIMRIVEEESGYARFEVERQLNRSLKFHGGENANGHDSFNGNVISGTFYEAEPIGIVDGLDYKLSGYPKFAYSQKILSIIENKDIALLTSSAISRNGDPINVNSDSLASYIAGEIGASKLIYCSNHDMVLKDKDTGEAIQNFRLQDAKEILKHYNIEMNEKKFFASFHRDNNCNDKDTREQDNDNEIIPISAAAQNMLLKIGWACLALGSGVDRAHIVSPSDGALLTELFTAQEGSGTCIVQDDSQELHPDEVFYGDMEKTMNQFFEGKPLEILDTLFDDINTVEDEGSSDRRKKLKTSFF